MGYEIILIAHFCYVLVMYSLAVKEFQCLLPQDMHLICNAYWLDTDALQGCDLPKIKTATFFEPERDNLLSCNDGILLHKESFREQL